MFQGCITASGTGQLAVIGSIRNFSLYQKVSDAELEGDLFSRIMILQALAHLPRNASKRRN